MLSILTGLFNLGGILFFAPAGSSPEEPEDDFQKQRNAMVENQIQARNIRDKEVLKTMRKVKRHLFVPERLIHYAYSDSPLPIGYNQTISQPYIVALMTELARLKPDDKVLEIGTGSGYQTAVLAELAEKVYSMEIVEELANESKIRLSQQNYHNVEILCADGYAGYPKEAPYDAIIVTAAADETPQKLISQLKNGGRMIIPMGEYFQELYVITKDERGQIKQETTIPVRFVPMIHPKN